MKRYEVVREGVSTAKSFHGTKAEALSTAEEYCQTKGNKATVRSRLHANKVFAHFWHDGQGVQSEHTPNNKRVE